MPVEVRLEGGLAQVHPDRGVAADAEVAVRAVRQLSDLRLHRVEDRAELGVGVGRDRPLAVDLPVARGAGGRRRKPFFDEERGVPVLDFVRLRGRRRRSSRQHRDCPQEANSAPNKGPVPVAAPVPAIELTAQRNAWHRGGRFFEPSPAGRRGTTGSMRSTPRSELDYGDVCRSTGHFSRDSWYTDVSDGVYTTFRARGVGWMARRRGNFGQFSRACGPLLRNGRTQFRGPLGPRCRSEAATGRTGQRSPALPSAPQRSAVARCRARSTPISGTPLPR